MSLGFMAWAGEPDSVAWWTNVIPFLGWALSPYAILAIAALSLRRSNAARYTLLVGALLLFASSAFALSDALIFDVRDQSGLVFLGLPMGQIPGAVLCTVVAIALRVMRPDRMEEGESANASIDKG